MDASIETSLKYFTLHATVIYPYPSVRVRSPKPHEDTAQLPRPGNTTQPHGYEAPHFLDGEGGTLRVLGLGTGENLKRN